jgi:hypothetical protein
MANNFGSPRGSVVALPSDMPSATLVAPYIDRCWTSDFGIGGAEWYSDGTRWRLCAGKKALQVTAPGATTSINTATDTKVASVLIPDGSLQVGDLLYIITRIAKAGVATESIRTRYRIGTANSIADTAVLDLATPTNTNRVATNEQFFRVESATTILTLGSSVPWDAAGGTATPAATTISSIALGSADLYFSISSLFSVYISDTGLLEYAEFGLITR